MVFKYGRSFLGCENAISIHDVELPFQADVLPLLPDLNMPVCIHDAAPDEWGRRVLINYMLGRAGHEERGLPPVPGVPTLRVGMKTGRSASTTGAMKHETVDFMHYRV